MRTRMFARDGINSKNAKKGFTLVEMLISIVLMLIITATVGKLLFVYVAHFEQASEITTARQRGEMVLAILEGPVLHAGMGMPNAKDKFTEVFPENSTTYHFDDWEGPVCSADNEIDEDYGDEIRIAYAVPAEAIVKENDGSGTLTFNSGANLSLFEEVTGSYGPDLNNWAIFPSIETPFLIIDKKTEELEVSMVSTNSDAKVEDIALYDNLCSLRSMKAFVKKPAGGLPGFYVDSGAGEQPRVDGIGALHFDWDQDRSLVTVSILALGSQRHSEEITTGDVPLWDEDNWGWKEDYRHYRLEVINGSWRVRN